MTTRPTLRRKLAVLIASTTVISLLVFSGVAYLGIYLEEADFEMIPEADDDATQFLLIAFGIAAPISLVLTLTAARWLSRRALRPIEEVIAGAAAMSVDHLDRRLELPAQRSELHDMVDTLNGLFARLEVGFAGLQTFAADVSHELRTPLAVVISELEVASRRTRTHAEWSEAADRALQTLRRMVQLVEALLELARGGIPGPRERVELTALADEVVGMNCRRAELVGVRLTHSSRDPIEADVNRASLATAMSALVENAVRYTPSGGRVEVSVANADTGGVVIAVDDTGPGVPADERSVIFAPLIRGAAGREADVRHGSDRAGLGLGLAIVRRIAEQADGEVEVEASALGGARFVIRLPPTVDPGLHQSLTGPIRRTSQH
jgi:signal transduction histidine kinase